MSRLLLTLLAIAMPLAAAQTVAASPSLSSRETRKKYADALEAARKQNDVPGQAAAALLLGFSDVGAADEAAARAHLRDSSRLFESIGDHAGAWLALVAEGEVEKGETNYDAAVDAYARAVGVLTRASAPGEKFSIERLQAIGGFLGLDTTSLPANLLPVDLLKPIILMFANVMTRDGYGSALTEAGQLEKADSELAMAQQQSALFGGLFDASLAAHVGDLRRRQWRFDDARAEYRKALGGVGVLPAFANRDDDVRAGILARLADIELLSGKTDDALAWNDQELALMRATHNSRREASVLRERASLLYRGSRFEASAKTLDQALAIAQTAGADNLSGEILGELALLDMTRGAYGTAAARLERAIQLFAKSGDDIGAAGAWTTLSDVYMAMGLVANAKAAREQASELARKSGFRASIVSADLTAAAQRYVTGEGSLDELNAAAARAWATPEAESLLLRRGTDTFSKLVGNVKGIGGEALSSLPVPDDLMRVVGGIKALLEARPLIEKGDYVAARQVLAKGRAANPSRDFDPAFSLMTGVSWAKEGDLEKATLSMTEAAAAVETTIDDMRVEEMLASYLGSGRNIYFEVLIETLLRQGRVEEAFEVSERARARAFLQLVGNHRIDAKRGGDAQLIREAEALRAQIAQWQSAAAVSESPRSVAADLRQARVRYEVLLTRIKSSSPEYASLTAVAPASIDAIRAELPRDATLVSYFMTQWGVHVWLLDRERVQHVLLPATTNDVSRAGCWAADVARRSRGAVRVAAPCRDTISAEEVYRLLFAPLPSRLANRRLLIVAHGSLHYVPFAALRNPDTGRYLVEDYTVTYLPSASTLRFLRAKETEVDGTSLVFGDPAAAGLDDLPFAQREATDVAAALGVTPLLGADATESRLYALDRRVDLLHIAAHGTFDSDHPLFSGIALAPGEGHDGDLEVHEILNELDLSGVNLVVLAACDTGLGQRSGGDDVVGLTRALMYAGTPGVVATLWKIRDDASAVMMNEFYCHLSAGDSVAEALRLAQLAMLHGGSFSAPEEWAAFAVYGDPLGRWSAERHSSSTSR